MCATAAAELRLRQQSIKTRLISAKKNGQLYRDVLEWRMKQSGQPNAMKQKPRYHAKPNQMTANKKEKKKTYESKQPQ